MSIDPYILGSWLGDCTAAQPNITGEDTEVLEYWRDLARENDAELVHAHKKIDFLLEDLESLDTDFQLGRKHPRRVEDAQRRKVIFAIRS